jgi:hypothetical protein
LEHDEALVREFVASRPDMTSCTTNSGGAGSMLVAPQLAAILALDGFGGDFYQFSGIVLKWKVQGAFRYPLSNCRASLTRFSRKLQ